MFQIVVIDDDPAIQLVLTRLLKKQGYDVTAAKDGQEGLALAQQLHPALIICDWMMPRMNGIEVCRRVKADAGLSTTFFILLTSLDSVEDRVKGLDAGADDFISKPIEPNELQARVRSGLRLHQLSHDLRTQKQILAAELAEAAEYVRSLLPEPLNGPIAIQGKYIPSSRLGGDGFDYFWLDENLLAIYLMDTAGHGLKAALPSISVMNLLRSQALPNLNYSQPSQVLSALNRTFQMTSQNDKYFTIWYGVYNRVTRQLTYASAGHPPAILLWGTPQSIQHLKTPGMPVGMFEDVVFTDRFCEIPASSTLYIFSDGIYEIPQPDGTIWGLDTFINFVKNSKNAGKCNLDQILQEVEAANSKDVFDDDVSILEIKFD
ncbi:PP2C family protein-serine/threonine phosphatase [Argonema galeatum]|uniref:PP2C family protein-serine/threonine phosphatase n=1 Tax=Argonema galeatum TaxID=2942762 RepID=UPI0020135EAE|nr:SpoIIE family protein phosphatase [Argonema galeatum]MCL1464836.1 SpoIIE family protein phosphatase [Argonema galeatum A003/A1]